MNCQGLCADSCYSLAQTPLEQQHVLAETGVRLGLVQAPPGACPALTMLRRCAVYDSRPMICRLWGMTPAMRCQYGCQPEGGFLTNQQAYEFLARVAELAGDLALADHFRRPFLDDPEQAERDLLRDQRLRDFAFDQRVATAKRPVWVVGPGRLSKTNPRRGRL